MKLRILGLLAVGVLAAPGGVDAAPITYNVLFTGTAPLPSGTIPFCRTPPRGQYRQLRSTVALSSHSISV